MRAIRLVLALAQNYSRQRVNRYLQIDYLTFHPLQSHPKIREVNLPMNNLPRKFYEKHSHLRLVRVPWCRISLNP